MGGSPSGIEVQKARNSSSPPSCSTRGTTDASAGSASHSACANHAAGKRRPRRSLISWALAADDGPDDRLLLADQGLTQRTAGQGQQILARHSLLADALIRRPHRDYVAEVERRQTIVANPEGVEVGQGRRVAFGGQRQQE